MLYFLYNLIKVLCSLIMDYLSELRGKQVRILHGPATVMQEALYTATDIIMYREGAFS